MGIPYQGHPPHQAARDPIGVAPRTGVASGVIWPDPRWVPFWRFNQEYIVHKVFYPWK